jgi:tetratricopeptide (TPR) repeat protein
MRTLIFLLLFSYYNLYSETEVPVIVSSNSVVYIKVLSGLKYSIKTPLKVLFFNENRDEINVVLQRNSPVITIGNQATYYVRKNSNSTNIFTVTNYSREGIQYERGNSCGFFSEIPIQKIFLSLKDFSPLAKNITTFYTSPQGNYYTQIANQIDFLYGLNFKPKQIGEEENFLNELQKLKGNTDAFVILADPIYSKENFEVLSGFCKQNRIMLLSNISSLTDLGIGYSLDVDYFDLGIKTGNFANDILKDLSKCNYGPFSFPDRELLKINNEYLKDSGFLISKDIILKTEIDELNVAGMDMYLSGKKETSLNIFKYILKKAPDNENALKYSKLISNEKYDDQVKGLLEDANKFYDAQKYVEAKQIYEKVYKINPNIPNIKDKIDQCIFQSSEQKRQQAIQSQNANQYFQAISYYLDSLKILPSNTNTKQGLESLRKKLSENIPTMMNEGLLLYNHRKYKEAILIFKNILLIEEGNKKSKEYYRLSQEKMEAIERLSNCKNAKENPCAL